MSVRRTPRPVRANSLTPNCPSSARICWLIATGVTFRSVAAWEKLRRSAAASNDCNATMLGRWGRAMIVKFI